MQSNGQYQVDNAIIMAAGMSSRLAPLSYEKPKALLEVKGEVLIERQIRQILEAGVKEIVIVVGYLKEQFEYLREKYPVVLIENPYYEKRNNHSTLYVAREYLKNSYICSGDNYFTENVFRKYEEHAYYSTTFEEGRTDEWCVAADENGRITRVVIGGSGEWVMRGHVFLDREFSERLIPYLEAAMADDGQKDLFWENIYMDHIDSLQLYQKKFRRDIIQEFDDLQELRRFDSRYEDHTGSVIMKRIARELDCRESEIVKILPLKRGNGAVGIWFCCNEVPYCYYYEKKQVERA